MSLADSIEFGQNCIAAGGSMSPADIRGDHVRTQARGWTTVTGMGAAFMLLVTLISFAPFAVPSASAANSSDFNPGSIISDQIFYDGAAMNEAQVQAFLNARVPSCRAGYTCLKDYRQDTTNQPARAEGCAPYTGRAAQSAAAIIVSVGQACGINPQVIIVLLEKEQGLVSDDWPTSRQYRSATGYGCPDTADCDANYYGFFNQVYNAAYQFKKYRANPGIRNYQAGRWNTILWNPNTACGSSQVYIENQATAGLYVYTPYRPNAAALANLYGTGDACSAYGNRNFWRMFTDWFGNPNGAGSLAKSPNDPTVFVLSASVKFPIPDYETYLILAALGPIRTVDASYLASYPSSKPAGAAIRDPLTGEVSLVESGVRHRFQTCDQMAMFGFACGAAIDLQPTQLARFPVGGEVAPFMKVASAGTVFHVDGKVRRQVFAWDDARALNGGAWPFVATVKQSILDKMSVGPVAVGPGTLVKTPGVPDVYFIDGLGSRIRVPSFGVAAAYGARGYREVPSAALGGYPVANGDLSILATCGTGTFAAAGGLLHPADAAKASAGLPASPLSDYTCSRLPRGGALGQAVFVKTPTQPSLFAVSAGVRRAMPDWVTAVGWNGGPLATWLELEPDAIAQLPSGPGALPLGRLVKGASSPRIFLVDGTSSKIAVGSFLTASEVGVNGWTSVPDADVAASAEGPSALSRAIRCDGVDYFAAGGRLTPAAAAGHGLTLTTLMSSTCSTLIRQAGPALSTVFVREPTSADVYQIVGAQKRVVRSWASVVRIAGTASPTILVTGPGGLADLPAGEPIP